MRKTQEQKKPAAAAALTVDYPREGEQVTYPAYTFRVRTGAAERVEISIDSKEWQACRQAGGYWWYDWAGYQSGKHQAQVRSRTQAAGKTSVSGTTCFRVELS